MKLDKVRICNIRNIREIEFSPYPELNIIQGMNAQGKTSLLEALFMLSDGRSFRTHQLKKVISWDQDGCSVSGRVDREEIDIDLGIEVRFGKRKFYRGGAEIHRIYDYLGAIGYVVFTADHLGIVHGGPKHRRDLLDRALFTIYPGYLEVFRRYCRALSQRNAILREGRSYAGAGMEAWTETFIQAALPVMNRRYDYMKRLEKTAADVHKAVSDDDEKLELRYKPSFSTKTGPEKWEEKLREKFRESAEEEAKRRITLWGPHRDDVEITLNGRSLRTYGSRGQQKSAVLALKLAEFELYRNKTGEEPVFLLDDVMSELDYIRSEYFVGFIGKKAQAFLTTTDYDKIKRFPLQGGLWRMKKGELIREER